jgi:hypothetical protein
MAIDVRDHIESYDYGQIARVVTYNGQPVGAWKSHHTWTYRNNVLVTGICIPGVSLVVRRAPGDSLALEDTTTPDPNAAMFAADGPEIISWPLVLVTAGAIVAAGSLFALAIAGAGRAARR